MNKERYYHKLETIKESGNYRILREIEHNGFLIHDDGREMLNLSSNDYLGLSSNPRLIEEFREETDVMALPYSAVSSRLLSGHGPVLYWAISSSPNTVLLPVFTKKTISSSLRSTEVTTP